MRRTEFIAGIEQVQEALTESQLKALFDALLGQEGEPDSSQSKTAQVLTSLKEYTFRAQHFNEAARELTKLLGLEELEQPDVWTKLITGVDDEYLRRQQHRIDVVLNYLPQIATLLRQKTERTLEEAGFSHDAESLLTVVVIEEGGNLSSPQRLAELFEGIERLYEVCAVVAGVKADKLSVLSCESGQDKAFDLVGSPEVITPLKQLIMSIWDRVVFYRELDLTKRIERVSDSLYILEKIDEMEEDGRLGPEQAEILRRGVHNGVTKFMEAGAIIPEIQKQARYDPRQLMSPEPKLLAGGSQAATETKTPAADQEKSSPEPAGPTEPQEESADFSAEPESSPLEQDQPFHSGPFPPAGASSPEGETPSGTSSSEADDRTERDEVISVLERITRREEEAEASGAFESEPSAPEQEETTSSDEANESGGWPFSPPSSEPSSRDEAQGESPEETESEYDEQMEGLGQMFDRLEGEEADPLSAFDPSSFGKESEEEDAEDRSEDW